MVYFLDGYLLRVVQWVYYHNEITSSLLLVQCDYSNEIFRIYIQKIIIVTVFFVFCQLSLSFLFRVVLEYLFPIKMKTFEFKIWTSNISIIMISIQEFDILLSHCSIIFSITQSVISQYRNTTAMFKCHPVPFCSNSFFKEASYSTNSTKNVRRMRQ